MPRSAPLGHVSSASSVPSALLAGQLTANALISPQLISPQLISNQWVAPQLIAPPWLPTQSIARRPVLISQVPNPLKPSQLMDGPPNRDRSPNPGFTSGRGQAPGLEVGSRRAAGWLTAQFRGSQP